MAVGPKKINPGCKPPNIPQPPSIASLEKQLALDVVLPSNTVTKAAAAAIRIGKVANRVSDSVGRYFARLDRLDILEQACPLPKVVDKDAKPS